LKNIDLILPVVELRLDKFAGVVKKDKDGSYSKSDWNRINLHVIFDQFDPEIIRQQFLNSIITSYDLTPSSEHFKSQWQAVLTKESIKDLGQMVIDAAPIEKKSDYGSPLEEGFNNLCFSLDSIRKVLDRHILDNRFLLAVGKTEWENMKWGDQSIAEKRNIINYVDLVFTASQNPASYAAARKKLSENKVNDLLLDCSDAHNYSFSQDKDRIGNCFTWIKADSTFDGLRQALTEFNQRVFVGDTPPKILLVNRNRTKYVSSITIKKKPGSTLPDTWFDCTIPLNHDLVAIIGNKGSGKSALADILSLVGDTKNFSSFSFLNNTRFRDPKSKLDTHFVGNILWCDGTISQKDLNVNPLQSSVERIKYLPQTYLENLCNELAGGGSSTFDNELRKIIYTHVPEEERLGFSSLDELIEFKVSELNTGREQLIKGLSAINSELAEAEHKLSDEYRQSLEQQLETKKNELKALDNAKPIPVVNPPESDAAKQETIAATARLSELEGQLKAVLDEEQIARQKKADAVKGIAHVNLLLQAIKNFQKSYDQFISDLNPMLAEIDETLNVNSIITFKIDQSKIEQLGVSFKQISDSQDALFISQDDASLTRRREKIEGDIKAIKDQMGEKQRLFLVYKEQLKQWEKDKAELQGDKDKNNTIAWYSAAIEELKQLPRRKDQLKVARLACVRDIYKQIEKVVDEYRMLYQPVQKFVQSAASMGMSLSLDFNVRIVEEGFQDEFVGCINRQTRGSFSGIDESNQLIRGIIQATDFMNVDEVVSFVEKIDDMLHFDRRFEGTSQVGLSIPDQLRKGNSVEDLYNFLFGLSYLYPRYSLTYNAQEISQLSPGERGLLLLVFYLLVDKDDIPLVIDQPEENLDNQTIYKILVTCIKKAKQQRQVIMVTHNPNLAVVCDAEQIICATCDKKEKRFTYTSGAIESQEIKEQVVAILEGTQPAFINRKRKYGF
jgi:ABC-type lipoprotein export system ATPase subunit